MRSSCHVPREIQICLNRCTKEKYNNNENVCIHVIGTVNYLVQKRENMLSIKRDKTSWDKHSREVMYTVVDYLVAIV